MYRYGSKSRTIIASFEYFRTVIDLTPIEIFKKVHLFYSSSQCFNELTNNIFDTKLERKSRIIMCCIFR